MNYFETNPTTIPKNYKPTMCRKNLTIGTHHQPTTAASTPIPAPIATNKRKEPTPCNAESHSTASFEETSRQQKRQKINTPPKPPNAFARASTLINNQAPNSHQTFNTTPFNASLGEPSSRTVSSVTETKLASTTNTTTIDKDTLHDDRDGAKLVSGAKELDED